MNPLLRRLLAALALLVVGAFCGQLVVYVAIARGGDELEPWHRIRSAEELGVGLLRVDDLEAYRELEDRLFAEIDRRLEEEVESFPIYSRFDRRSSTYPDGLPVNWNRTFEHRPEQIRGSALLLHGLSDSPYSVRSAGELLAAAGFHTVGLRLPGHGTAPGTLAGAAWEDWQAAVRLGVAALTTGPRPPAPFVLVGYSNGAALALDYTLEALERPDLPVPDRLVFLSPAFAVTRLASLARWQRLVSALPLLEKLSWNSVRAEYDPFKYNSFPLRAAEEIYRVTTSVEARLARLESTGRTNELPPVLTLQSVVDATVPPIASLTRLYGRLEENGSELVLFDVNRYSRTEAFLSSKVDDLLKVAKNRQARGFGLTLVTNTGPDSLEIEARTRPAGESAVAVEPLGLAWPRGVYSLSHVALPFPPDDPVYGVGPGWGGPFPFGQLEARGERGALIVPMDLLMRLRYNPFFEYVEIRVERFLGLERPLPIEAPM